jgi:hypothetical protein
MRFCFDRFEDGQLPDPIAHFAARELLWQFLETIALVPGAHCIAWRWKRLLNLDALWLALSLVLAETCACLGLVLLTIKPWKTAALLDKAKRKILTLQEPERRCGSPSTAVPIPADGATCPTRRPGSSP